MMRRQPQPGEAGLQPDGADAEGPEVPPLPAQEPEPAAAG